MKTNIVITQQTMTSLEIAELTGKQHKHVMEAIRKMEPAWVKTCGSNFRLTSRTIVQPNGGTRCQARCDILFFVSDYMISFTRKPRLVSSSITERRWAGGDIILSLSY